MKQGGPVRASNSDGLPYKIPCAHCCNKVYSNEQREAKTRGEKIVATIVDTFIRSCVVNRLSLHIYSLEVGKRSHFDKVWVKR